ncbi:MAG: UDP-N-acetylmuramate dehydrogenase [Candidatus Paceibacterota bacterium]
MDHIQSDVPLSIHTTFRIGGPAKYFVSITNLDELKDAVLFAREKGLPIFILGGGSNTLVSDSGFNGVVLKIEIIGIEFNQISDNECEIVMGAGEEWDKVVELSVSRGFSGFENLSGIPGTVGASPVQNIGAYGREIKDCISFVEVFDTENLTFKKMLPEDCLFDYRDSVFKKEEGKKFVVTRVGCILKKDVSVDISYKDLNSFFEKVDKKNITPSMVRDAVVEIRKNKLPDLKIFGTAGSFFKNPIISNEHYELLKEKFGDIPCFDFSNEMKKVSAAWILDNVCNFKGYREGNVGVYKNQSLVIVNFGGATADEIKNLSKKMCECVKKNTDINLSPEIIFV